MPTWPKNTLRDVREESNVSRKGAKGSHKEPKEGQKGPQKLPKRAQRKPEWAMFGPKGGKGQKTRKRHETYDQIPMIFWFGFFIDFLMVFGDYFAGFWKDFSFKNASKIRWKKGWTFSWILDGFWGGFGSQNGIKNPLKNQWKFDRVLGGHFEGTTASGPSATERARVPGTGRGGV